MDFTYNICEDTRDYKEILSLLMVLHNLSLSIHYPNYKCMYPSIRVKEASNSCPLLSPKCLMVHNYNLYLMADSTRDF